MRCKFCSSKEADATEEWFDMKCGTMYSCYDGWIQSDLCKQRVEKRRKIKMPSYMKYLKKQPETELEFWDVIDSLGGMAWHMGHDLGHGRIEDTDGCVSKEINAYSEAVVELVKDMCDKFNVSLEKEDGKVYYWDWYSKNKDLFYRNEYDNIICSSCPYSEGADQMVKMGGTIPCSKWGGVLSRLPQNFQCAIMSFKGMAHEDFCDMLRLDHGQEALMDFCIKETNLRKIWEDERAKEQKECAY